MDADQQSILIVDDEPRLASSAAELLKNCGYRTRTLNDPAAAVAHINSSNYDLVLLDVNMPAMSGFQVLEALDLSNLNTLFMIMTGDATADTAIEALRKGAVDYIRKPFDPDELIIRISNALDQKSLRHDKHRIEAENRHLELELRQAQKMEAIGTLASGIAHDFNNILSIIIGNSELAYHALENESPVREKLRSVLSASTRAKELVYQLLQFSRKEAGTWNSLELNSAIADCLKLIRATIPSNIRIVQHPTDTSVFIQGDATQIHQVIINLCANAAHAMEPLGGRLEIKLDERPVSVDEFPDIAPGPFIRISVKDTGTGLDPAIRSQIFDPYFTTKDRGRGTGMGLAVVHGIVKNHGGHIEVISEVGFGTEIQILLPVLQANDGEIKADAPASLLAGNEHILLVDDEEMIVDVVRSMLLQLGYRVHAETSSLVALRRFKANPNDFDLIITDLTMPGLNGEQFSREASRVKPGIPILLCSGFINDNDAARINDSGISRYLTKPISLLELSSTLRELLDQTGNERRRAPRIEARGAFVIIGSASTRKCPVLDLSLSGLALLDEESLVDSQQVTQLSIVSANDESIVENIPFHVVSKGGGSRRRGVNFEGLTLVQSEKLDAFLQSQES